MDTINAFVISFGFESQISMNSETKARVRMNHFNGMVKSSLVDIYEATSPLRVEVE